MNLFWPSKIICSLILMQSMFNVWLFGDKKVEKLVFGRSGLNSCVFEKLLNSYSCISFIKYSGLSGFYIKYPLFFKNVTFLDFQSIKAITQPIKIAIKILVWIYLTQSVLDWCSIDRIYFSINRSSISTNRISKAECFKKRFSHMFFISFKNFQILSLTFSLRPIQSKIVCRFLPQISPRFLSSSTSKSFIPFLFH